jgi:hypothetical protein
VTLSPLGLGGQRRRVKALAAQARVQREQARMRRADLHAELGHRITRPASLAMVFVLGLTVGTLAPRDSAAGTVGGGGGQRGPATLDPVWTPLVRAARTFMVRRLVGLIDG